MSLKVVKVSIDDSPEGRHRILVRATCLCDIGDYLIIRVHEGGTVGRKNFSPIGRFPQKRVRTGDFIAVCAGIGPLIEHEMGRNVTTHIIFMKKDIKPECLMGGQIKVIKDIVRRFDIAQN